MSGRSSIAGLLAGLFVLMLWAAPAPAERIKDIVDIQGVRGNWLWGYGLVVGLNGTGDNSEASKRALSNMLKRTGLTLKPSELESKNIASVLVTAELGPFSRKGGSIDVTLSALGNTSSLQGGTLMMTPLQAADGSTYAVAQGPITLGGYSASGEAASVSKNHTTVARIANGARVEKEELAEFVENGRVILQLKNADFETAERIAKAVNAMFPQSAVADDAGSVKVQIPPKLAKAEVTKFISEIGSMDVQVDFPAIVVINERTGTIVVGENVKISTVAFSLGSLSIVTQEKEMVSQPMPGAERGKTEKVKRTDLDVTESGGTMRVIPRTISVAELVRALNALGLSPRDMIPVFEALREAGALQAQLKVM